jgi:glycine/D-amino acid oxidase-like deaminating enzyme
MALPLPRLEPDRILRRLVGLRPCRKGGLRLEVERLPGLTVVHHYGHGGCGITLAPGSAELAAELVQAQGGGGDREPVAVLGAGVVGLATAAALGRRGIPVEVVADRVGPRATSGVAGAVWLPTGIDFPDDPGARGLLNEALRRSGDLFADPVHRRAWGVRRMPVYEPADFASPPAYFESGVLRPPSPVPDPPPLPVLAGGRCFTTDLVETPRMLDALAAEVRGQGARFRRAELRSLRDVRALGFRRVVHCLGLGARTVFDDEDVFPARGLLLHLPPEPLGWIFHAGYSYVFPRADALVLGGSFEPEVDDLEPPDAAFDRILDDLRGWLVPS